MSLVEAVVDYVAKTIKEQTLEEWLMENYKWPTKVDSDSPFKRVKMYFLFDRFFVNHKILDSVNPILDQELYTLMGDFLNRKDGDDWLTMSLADVRKKLKYEDITRYFKELDKCKQKLLDDMILKHVNSNFSETKKIKNVMSEITNSDQVNVEEKIVAADFFIADWGGVGRNNVDTIKYHVQRCDEMREGGEYPLKGIASWSKYLSIKKFGWAHIYDSRICFSLNALIYLDKLECPAWKIKEGKHKYSGYVGTSRNSRIEICEEYIMAQNIMRYDHVVSEADCYREYLVLLNDVERAITTSTTSASQIEMFLFIIADNQLCKSILEESSTDKIVAAALNASFFDAKKFGKVTLDRAKDL